MFGENPNTQSYLEEDRYETIIKMLEHTNNNQNVGTQFMRKP
jgi:hypothetical protein